MKSYRYPNLLFVKVFSMIITAIPYSRRLPFEPNLDKNETPKKIDFFL
jgi:hypothetical protein